MWEWIVTGFNIGLKCCGAFVGFFVAAIGVFWGSVILFVAFSEAVSRLRALIAEWKSK